MATAAAATPVMSPPSRPMPAGKRGRVTVDEQGEVSYKKTTSKTLMASLQLGLHHSIGRLEPKPRRDILMTDFQFIEIVDFPSVGSDNTPAHRFPDFTFKTYSPVGFRFFREAFGIKAEDFLVAMCDRPLRELSNSGASGSLFFLSADDAFILKTVQKKEAKFLQKLLPGYYMNLTQNKKTLLPKFFGLYRYKSNSVNIRVAVMNNLLPSNIKYHEKYDLKGSTYKRKASPHELTKTCPTFKDLDYRERHDDGIALTPENFEILMRTMDRDCRVLESFSIMDFSLLLGVHYIDHGLREQFEAGVSPSEVHAEGGAAAVGGEVVSKIDLNKNYSVISGEEIPIVPVEETDDQPQATPANISLAYYPEGYVQGKVKGERVIIYLGIIDILQSYRFRKKVEHTVKSIIADGATVSVTNPSFYGRRFLEFTSNMVFKKERGRTKTRRNSQKARRITAVNKGVKPVTLTTQQSQDDPQDSLNMFQNSLPQGSDLTDSLLLESNSLFNKRTSRDNPTRYDGNLPEIQVIRVRTPAGTPSAAHDTAKSMIFGNRSEPSAPVEPGTGKVASPVSVVDRKLHLTVEEETEDAPKSQPPSSEGGGEEIEVRVNVQTPGTPVDLQNTLGVRSIVVENQNDSVASGLDAATKVLVVETKEITVTVGHGGDVVDAQKSAPPSSDHEGGEKEFVENVNNTSTPTGSLQNQRVEAEEEVTEETVVMGDASVVEKVQQANSSFISEVI